MGLAWGGYCIQTCTDIIDHIAAEMKMRMAEYIMENKLCLLIEESTTISGKSGLVLCLRSAVAGASPETFHFDLLELEGTADLQRIVCSSALYKKSCRLGTN